MFYRNLIQHYKLDYIIGNQQEQKPIAINILDSIHGLDPSGRFLELNQESDIWFEVDDGKALRKIRQALREGAPEIRKQITPASCSETLCNLCNGLNDNEECKQFLEMIFQNENGL